MRYGFFDDQNNEYVIDKPDVPVSWTNYLGVHDLCTVLSHNAGGYSFYKTAEHHRITRFRQNGIPLDRPGHYVYIRDDDTGEFWSISWQPVGKDLKTANYKCRHGLSYSIFSSAYRDIHAEQLVFIPVDDDVELWDVRIHNKGSVPRRLSVFSYLEFSFHHIDIDNQNLQMSLYASGSSYQDGIIENDFFYEPWTYHFFTASFSPDSYDCVRDQFIGVYHSEADPQAVQRGICSNSSELGGNHCAALHKRLTLSAAESVRLLFMLGVGPHATAKTVRAKYSDWRTVDEAFSRLRAYWQAKRNIFHCETPNRGLNTMINTWTLLQAETCVVWSRFASFIETGGRTGLGFRDTAQDVMAVVHTNPDKCRQRLLELLHGQVSAGYGLHLFDPEIFHEQKDPLPGVKLPTVVPTPSPKDVIHGMEDACSDDALWLVAAVCEFVVETGELAFLEQVVPYADQDQATVYDHMKCALDFSMQQVGDNGICKGLRADWNDCLNLGGGESALVSFLHYWALTAFIETARHLRRMDDVTKYQALADSVQQACEQKLWDGHWYLRGITRQGIKIGSHANTEGRIFIESNSWAVLSGVASLERAQTCLDAVYEHLFSKYGLHLLWPAFTKPDDDIGYATRVYPGIKENGAIFSHPNPWVIIAECKIGHGNRAMEYYDALLPYNQNDLIEIRQAEPYSYCQFIMGRDHTAFGRGRHPWLTGSAGWNYTAATRWILGVRPTYDGLLIDPCIPAEWDHFSVQRQWRGAMFMIEVENPNARQQGVQSISLNGRQISNPIPAQPAGSVNHVRIVLG